jgi:hypothetical protein
MSGGLFDNSPLAVVNNEKNIIQKFAVAALPAYQ